MLKRHSQELEKDLQNHPKQNGLNDPTKRHRQAEWKINK